MKEKIEIIISDNEYNQRIDKLVKKYLKNTPISLIYKMFRTGKIKVNSKKINISYICQLNDKVEIFDYSNKKVINNEKIPKIKYEFKIIYEDNNVLIINKPKGILIHPDDKENINTLNNQVLNYLIDEKKFNPQENVSFTPTAAHRLDRNTSGLIVYGKNFITLQTLFKMFKSKDNLSKKYLAIVFGRVGKSGIINKNLKKDKEGNIVKISNSEDSLTAITKYRPLDYNDDFSLLEVEILTGRTHQIRAHLAFINHPIIGDAKYGNFNKNKALKNINSQYLHAYQLYFNNCLDHLSYLNKRLFTAELNNDDKKILEHLNLKMK